MQRYALLSMVTPNEALIDEEKIFIVYVTYMHVSVLVKCCWGVVQEAALEEQLFGQSHPTELREDLLLPVDEDRGDVDSEGDGIRENAAAWHDSDDDGDGSIDLASGSHRLAKLARQGDEETGSRISGKEYEKRLREQYVKMKHSKTVAWVQKLREEASQGDASPPDDTVQGHSRRVGGLLLHKGSIKRIPPGRLEITKLADGNKTQPSQSIVNAVEFHPGGQLLMTAGLDRRVRFFSVDGVKNPHVQSIFFEDMPVHSAQFLERGSKIFCSGRRSFFYALDLETSKVEKISKLFGREEKSFESFIGSNASDVVAFIGQDGSLPLVSISSRQLIDTLKMNGTVRSGAFSNDGLHLYTGGGDGIVHVWDMRMRRCVRQFFDEGSLGTSTMAVTGSSSSTVLASGSKSGIVNVYNDVLRSNPMQSSMGAETVPPFKTLTHLTTVVDSMTFSTDGQLLVMASRMKRDALRLIHVPTMTAFSNWPTSKSPLHYVHSVALSPSSGYLAIGNARGRVVMYRLHHYPVI